MAGIRIPSAARALLESDASRVWSPSMKTGPRVTAAWVELDGDPRIPAEHLGRVGPWNPPRR